MPEKTKIARNWAVAIILATSFVCFVFLTAPNKEVIGQHRAGSSTEHAEYCCQQSFGVTYGPIILSGLTLVVLIWQAWIYSVQADILHRQAETLPRIERAYLRVKIAENGLHVGATGLHGNVNIERGTFRLSVENNGKTPAEITRIAWDIGLVARSSDPTADSIIEAIDPSKIGGRAIPPGIESAPGDPYLGESENLVPRFRGAEHEQIAKDTHALWVRGFVRYRDVFARNHIVGFCFAFDSTHNIFVSRGDTRYNYKRSEEIDDIPPAGPWPPS